MPRLRLPAYVHPILTQGDILKVYMKLNEELCTKTIGLYYQQNIMM